MESYHSTAIILQRLNSMIAGWKVSSQQTNTHKNFVSESIIHKYIYSETSINFFVNLDVSGNEEIQRIRRWGWENLSKSQAIQYSTEIMEKT